jgi:hypothetical protein
VPEQSNTQRSAIQAAGQRPGIKSARGLAQSKTLREYQWSRSSSPASWSAAAFRRFSPGKLLKAKYLSFFDKKDLTNGVN